jgi:hypothetical protein
MTFTRRHAASPSLDARTSRPWDGRSSRKSPWFTFLAPVYLLALKDYQPDFSDRLASTAIRFNTFLDKSELENLH